MIPFTGQKHAHSDTNNVDGERKRRRVDTSKKYGCVCTCCHRKNLMRCDCVIFLKQNYDVDNSNIADALSKRYREVGNKEFISKPCHTKLQHSHFSTLNSNGVDHSKNMVVMNSNDTTPSMEFHMTSLDFTQNPTYQITVYAHVATNLIYQGLNASYSRHQDTILTHSVISPCTVKPLCCFHRKEIYL